MIPTPTMTAPTLGDIRIDKKDRHLLEQCTWFLKQDGTGWDVCATVTDPTGARSTLLLRRVVMAAGRGERVTTLDGDHLNCHRSNLAFATMAQVQAGQAPQRNAQVPYKGIDFYRPLGKWRARLATQHLGYFDTLEEAAACYAVAARERYGVFARNGGQVLMGDGH